MSLLKLTAEGEVRVYSVGPSPTSMNRGWLCCHQVHITRLFKP
jgi:hypothetical protein